MIISNQDGKHIHNLEDWLAYAPPASGNSRSTLEIAKSWMTDNGPIMPSDLAELLSTHPDTVDFEAEWAILEYGTTLNAFNGNGHNHDLIIFGSAAGKKTLIGIEAKVDEPFGEIVADYLSRNENDSAQLSHALFGDKDVSNLRYQLIHAVAGTLIEAKNRGAYQAIFIVHEFISARMNALRALGNKADFVEFVEKLTEVTMLFTIGQLKGPFTVPGGGKVPSDIPLYIGYVRTATI